jgi:hypothetical protein
MLLPRDLRLAYFINQPLETSGPLACHLRDFLRLLHRRLDSALVLSLSLCVCWLMLVRAIRLVLLIVRELEVDLINDIVRSDLRVLE